MKLLVITSHYLPDGGPSAALYALLCEALVRRGHKVTVISTVPHYPSGRVADGYRGWRVRKSVENGVRVIRLPVSSVRRGNLALRMFQIVCYQLGMLLVGLHLNYEIVLICSPVFQLALPFAVLAVLRRKPAVYSVHDIYPDVGVALGVFRWPSVIGFVAALERFCLRYAGRVRILSESFISPLKALGVSEGKLKLIYDWVDTDLIRPLPRETDFTREHGLRDKYIVLHAGNVGLSQGLENVILAAERLITELDLQFVFVGDGAGRSRLMSEVNKRRLTNVTFIPFQARERLAEVLATADISLVNLKRGLGFLSLPSKIISIFSSGRPLVACLDEESGGWNLILRSRAGLCVRPEDPQSLAYAILKLKRDSSLCRQMGWNGRAFALQNHLPEAASIQFERLLEAVMLGEQVG